MNRLVVNPNKPDTWEIQLKDGANHLGRSDDTDFKIADASVSSSHCQIVVNDGTVSIHDLGSTNGTFINGAPVQEAKLQNGQTIRLGGIEMIFCTDAPQPATSPTTTRLRVSVVTKPPMEASPVASQLPPLPPVIRLHPAAASVHTEAPARPLARPLPKASPKASGEFSLGLGILGAFIGALVGVAAMYGFCEWAGFRFPLLGVGIGVLTGLGAKILFKGTDSTLGIISGVIALVAVVGTLYLMYGTFPVISIISVAVSVSMAYRISSG